MSRKKIPFAICYDFDGTLSPYNMQEKSFIPGLKIKPATFWDQVKKHAEKHDMDEILAYMFLMLQEAKRNDLSLTKSSIADHGKDIDFFPGVIDWFSRINTFAKFKNVALEHYIISSGLKEMIEKTSIAKNFKYIFASAYQYDRDEIAVWPATAVNYTNKTQCLFRINKGIINSWDNSKINKYISEKDRPVPFSNMIYIGDGETDIPAMKMVKHQGGSAIAVYNSQKKGSKAKSEELIQNNRADFATAADFSENKQLDRIVKAIIDRTVLQNGLNQEKRSN